MRWMSRGVVWGVLLLLSSPALAGDVIVGTVRDSRTQQPLTDVWVKTTSVERHAARIVYTDAAGQYEVMDLSPGLYDLRFERLGYTSFTWPNVQLRPDRLVRVDVLLQQDASSPTQSNAEFIKILIMNRPRPLACNAGHRPLEPEGNPRNPLHAPDWALPHLIITPLGGEPWPVYRASTSIGP